MNDDDTQWWQALNNEAEEWEAEFNQRKAMQNGLPIMSETLSRQRDKQEQKQ